MKNSRVNITSTLSKRNIAIVGNNDGPILLYNSLKNLSGNVSFIGLQKKPSSKILNQYSEVFDTIPYMIGFNDESLAKYLKKKDKTKFLINAFCNFKFKNILNVIEVYNLHLSYLPEYRGRHPLHWAIINGEKTHGVTIHRMDSNFDNGKIIWQKKVKISIDDSAKSLRKKLMSLVEKDFYFITKDILCENFSFIDNPKTKATYAPRRFPKDNQIIDMKSASDVFCLVNALKDEISPAYYCDGDVKKYVRKSEYVNIRNNQLENKVNTSKHLYFKCLDGSIIKLYFEKN